MCGISGIIGEVDNRRSRVEGMVAAMQHRGPDDHGVVDDGSVTLGMTRLAILDLSPAGHQPMSNAEKTIWIVFNGEIYNFREERALLEKKKYRFRSGSDTEVLLAMYQEYGDQFLTRLRGMFALAIYDKRRGVGQSRFLLARDHLGIKPLMYQYQSGVLVFGSEIKTMLASGLVERRIDAESLRMAMTYGSVLQPRTILHNVQMLLPAHRMVIEGDHMTIAPYWSLAVDRVKGLRQAPYADQVAKVKEVLTDSVTHQMIGDVPVGAFLSGGVDSGLTVAIMTRLAKAKVKTFSLGFADEGRHIDETDDAQMVARHLGTKHSRVLVSAGDIGKDIHKIARFLDQPTVDGVNSYYISRAARSAVTVAISGTGGDELFAGYPWFITMQRIANSSNPAKTWLAGTARSRVLDPAAGRLEGLRRSGGFLAQFARQYQIYGSPGAFRILSQSVRTDSSVGIDPSFDIASADQLAGADTLDRVSALTLRGYTQNQLLRDIDVASMAHSLEVRVPFLDPSVADVALSLASESKLHQNHSNEDAAEITYQSSGAKRILVDIAKEWLPSGIDQQKKRGFAMPFDAWLRTTLKEVMDDTLSPESVRARNLFDVSRVTTLRQQFEVGRQSWPSIWMLMMTELWCREVLDAA